jgi:small subunit ribosomal protein S1
VNRGGLLVTVEGIKAFVPTSQMSQKDKEDLDAMVGKTLSAKVMEADPEAGRLLMSARRAATACSICLAATSRM